MAFKNLSHYLKKANRYIQSAQVNIQNTARPHLEPQIQCKQISELWFFFLKSTFKLESIYLLSQI